jgi:hypothetical protein
LDYLRRYRASADPELRRSVVPCPSSFVTFASLGYFCIVIVVKPNHNLVISTSIISNRTSKAAQQTLITEKIVWLLIRIYEWNDYQHIVDQTSEAAHVIFLSGQREKYTSHLRILLKARIT